MTLSTRNPARREAKSFGPAFEAWWVTVMWPIACSCVESLKALKQHMELFKKRTLLGLLKLVRPERREQVSHVLAQLSPVFSDRSTAPQPAKVAQLLDFSRVVWPASLWRKNQAEGFSATKFEGQSYEVMLHAEEDNGTEPQTAEWRCKQSFVEALLERTLLLYRLWNVHGGPRIPHFVL